MTLLSAVMVVLTRIPPLEPPARVCLIARQFTFGGCTQESAPQGTDGSVVPRTDPPLRVYLIDRRLSFSADC